MRKIRYLFYDAGASVALCETRGGNRFLQVRGVRSDVVLGILRALCPSGRANELWEGKTC